MKTVLKFFACLLGAVSVLMLSACSGNVDDSSELVLTADRTSIVADGSDAVRFTVTLDGEDVTSESSIRCISPVSSVVENAQFTATEAGSYSFEAEYQGYFSSVRIVSATVAPLKPSRFVRNICVMEFTGQWCSQCPAGYNYLWFVISKKYADTAHIMALHNDDDMSLDLETEIFRNYSLSGYPAVVVDMRDPSLLNGDVNGVLPKSLKNSVDNYPAHCGVAVSTSGSGTVTVTAKLFSERGSEYSLAVWVVEDGIVTWQNVGGANNENYTHGHVARRLVSSSWRGDSLGNVPAEEEVVKTYTIVPDGVWNLDNTMVYVLAIDAEGHVNNMAVCPIKDGNADYRYVTE